MKELLLAIQEELTQNGIDSFYEAFGLTIRKPQGKTARLAFNTKDQIVIYNLEAIVDDGSLHDLNNPNSIQEIIHSLKHSKH